MLDSVNRTLIRVLLAIKRPACETVQYCCRRLEHPQTTDTTQPLLCIFCVKFFFEIEVNKIVFRKMWAEFEWENKVTVNTNICDLLDYLHHILTCTNMKCLTPEKVHVLLSLLTMYN